MTETEWNNLQTGDLIRWADYYSFAIVKIAIPFIPIFNEVVKIGTVIESNKWPIGTSWEELKTANNNRPEEYTLIRKASSQKKIHRIRLIDI